MSACGPEALGSLRGRWEEDLERELGVREIDPRAELAMWKVSRS